jgi:MFS family permease
MTMLYRIYDKNQYASITSFTFIPSLIAPSIAPLLGGLLLDYFGWRYIFLLSGPICLALSIFAMIVLKEDAHRNITPFDWLGFVLSSSLLIAIFYTLSLIGRNGLCAEVLIGIMIFSILAVCFIWWEKRTYYPLINLSCFNSDIFLKANLIQLCFQVCHFGAIFIVSIYLQVAIGMSATIAGLIMGMQGFGAITTSRYFVKLFNKHGPKVPIIIYSSRIKILSLFFSWTRVLTY